MKGNQDRLKERFSDEEIRACREKKRFRTQEDALLNFLRQKQTVGLLEPLIQLKSYRCEHCGGWHNTKDYDAITLPVRQSKEVDQLFLNGRIGEAQKRLQQFKKERLKNN